MRGIDYEWLSRPDLYYDPTKKRLSTHKPKTV